MTMQKQDFSKCLLSKCIKNEKLKYPIVISIQTIYSVLSWSTFGSDYNLEPSWVWRNKLFTPGFGDVLPFFSADPLKFRHDGWRPSVDRHFEISPEMLDCLQARALAGPLKEIHRVVPKPLLHCLGCVLRVIVLLEGKPSAQSERRSWALWTRFSLRISLYFAPFSFPSSLDQSPSPCCWKKPSQHDAATTMLHCWNGIGQAMRDAWFMKLWIEAKQFNLGFIRPDNLVYYSLRFLSVFFCRLQVGFHVSFTKEIFPSDHSAIKPRLVEGCSDGCRSESFSLLHLGSQELHQSGHWVLGHHSYQGPSPPTAQFGWVASSRKSPGCSKLLSFKNYRGHCAHGNLQCSRIFFSLSQICAST